MGSTYECVPSASLPWASEQWSLAPKITLFNDRVYSEINQEDSTPKIPNILHNLLDYMQGVQLSPPVTQNFKILEIHKLEIKTSQVQIWKQDFQSEYFILHDVRRRHIAHTF